MATAALGIFKAALPLVSSIYSGLSRRNAAKRAGTALAESGNVAKNDIYGASAAGQRLLSEAGTSGIQQVYDASEQANAPLKPYQAAGEQGIGALSDLAKGGFKFSPQDYLNDPAYQFQLNKGREAIENRASARGLAGSGNVLTALTDYGQGLASTYYDQAFQRALKTFGANVDINDILAGRGQRATEEFGANTIGAGRSAADIGLRTAENMSDVGTQAAARAAPITLGIGEAEAGSILGANAGTRGAVQGGAMSLAELIQSITGSIRKRNSGGWRGGPVEQPG